MVARFSPAAAPRAVVVSRSIPIAESAGEGGGAIRAGDPVANADAPSDPRLADPASVPSTERLLFGKDRRLRSRASIRLVYDEGVRERGRFVSLFLRAREPEAGRPAPWRVGITVTRKVSPKAVVRNRMRRRIREFFRTEQWKIEPGWDFVVNAQGPLEKATTPELAAELRRMISRGIRSARARKDSPNPEPGSKEPRKRARGSKKPPISKATAPSKSPAPDGRS